MSKPRAVIFDVDGTLCDTSSVIHYLVEGKPGYPGYKDFHRFHEESTGCPAHEHVASLTHALKPEIARIVVTAREARWYNHTLWWLLLNNIRFDHLFMRQWNDFRPDYEIKSEILDRIETRYEVVYAIDDNPNVIRLWRERGIPCTVVPGYED